MIADKTAPRQRSRPFKPGQSGNPKGMPSGSRHKATLILDQIGADAGASVLRAVVRAAEQGDMAAARIVLDRAWPVRRGRPVRLELPELQTAADLAAALAAVAGAVGRGEVSPEEGSAVAIVLEAQRKAIETQELERRIAALEAAKGSGA